jgi:hypothetical protein
VIENKVWSIAGAGRGLGADITRDEPSHIHLPRRRRMVRPDDRATAATRETYVGDEEHRRPAQPATEEA